MTCFDSVSQESRYTKEKVKKKKKKIQSRNFYRTSLDVKRDSNERTKNFRSIEEGHFEEIITLTSGR